MSPILIQNMKHFKDADAMILLTEWKEFRSPDFEELKNN